jgi:hypothetical protein
MAELVMIGKATVVMADRIHEGALQKRVAVCFWPVKLVVAVWTADSSNAVERWGLEG